jgi:hypothetical protein
MELAACDNTSSGGVSAFLMVVTPPTGDSSFATDSNIADVNTGVAATPGCGFFATDVNPDIAQIDNFDGENVYVQVGLVGGARLQAVRVYYTLQVSPPPATASFQDVPTGHPFFRFIEALRASGITAGCSGAPPLYCPDDPVTRGQMAVFLGRALGLHWAP